METAYPATQPPVSGPRLATSAEDVTTEEFRRGTVIAYLVLSSVVALSTLLPWVNLWVVQVSGLQLGVLGWGVLLAGGQSAFMAGRSLSQGRAVKGLWGAQFAAAGIGIGAFALAYMQVNDACQETFMAADSGSCAAAFLGNGARIAFFGSAGLGLTALFRKPTR